ncbi:MAG: thiamine pyrophosphate-binding protein [Deltaproteobacteria bacterium]|nr:thiamine pyrophosphate-binding protein [Deltaproteobacteria bacterium]
MTSANNETMTGGELIARMLQAEGVEVVFGIIDGTYLQLTKGLRDLGIRLITPRHETSAVHMAGAYARTTGRLGVCIASNGPGVANALPGVAVENGEGNRVLLITSSRRTGIIRPDRGGTFQHFDQVETIRPMAKWASGVDSFDRIAELMRRAFRESFRGRPGVVHLDVPEDLTNGELEVTPAMLQRPEQYRRTQPIAAAAAQVRDAADLLCDSGLAMIHAGSGIGQSHASDLLLELAGMLNAPVTTSWAGRGAIAETSPFAVPMIHIELNNRVRCEADVVLSLGTRFGETDWWGKPPYWRRPSEQRHVQVDIDEQILGLNKPVDVAVLADIRCFLEALVDELKQRDLTAMRAKQEAWLTQINAARESASIRRRCLPGDRRREHRGLGQQLSRDPAPPQCALDLQVWDARRGAIAGARREGGVPGPAGLLHSRRRSDGFPSPGDRNRDPQRPARDLRRDLRSSVGNGQAHATNHIEAGRNAAAQARPCGGIDQRRSR